MADKAQVCGGVTNQSVRSSCETYMDKCEAMPGQAQLDCEDYINLCTMQYEPNSSNYELETSSKNFKFTSIQACYFGGYVVAKEQQSAASGGNQNHQSVAGHSNSSSMQSTGQKFVPDGKTTFAQTFFDSGFRIETDSEQFTDVVFTLAQEGGDSSDDEIKGFIFRITYTAKSLGKGKYGITYSIMLDDTELCSNQTAEFTASGGEINERLAFGITLNSENDFSSVKSIYIVKL